MSAELLLEKLTWEEAKQALSKADYVIVPIGSNEQHGPHITLESDIAQSFEFSRRLAEKAYPELSILIAPKISYGASEHHMHFPGTVTLRQETLASVVTDVCESLARHGVKRIVLMNGHGGNTSILNVVATELQRKLGIWVMPVDWWRLTEDLEKQYAKTPFHGHACEIETSNVMYLNPSGVRKDRLRRPKLKIPYLELGGQGYEHRISLSPFRYWDEYTDTGAIGDPTQASLDAGKALVEAALTRMLEALREFKVKRKDPRPLSRSRH